MTENAASSVSPREGALPAVSVVITTRNRREDLCRALESVLRQTFPSEIVVMDDASEDGTAACIRGRYPHVRVIRSEARLGLVVQRNRAAAAARGMIVFSLDDDAVFVEPDTVARVVPLFAHPRVGAVAMPIVNVVDGRRNPLWNPVLPEPGFWIAPVYQGGAHAVRRDLFLKLGGYEEALFQWGEEDSYCRKLYANGYVVRVAECGVTEHYPNHAGRHERAKNVWIYRNAILNVWFSAPGLLVPALWLFESLRWLYSGVRNPRSLPVVLEGLARGFWWSMTHPAKRSPLCVRDYMFSLRLRASKVKRLNEEEAPRGSSGLLTDPRAAHGGGTLPMAVFKGKRRK